MPTFNTSVVQLLDLLNAGERLTYQTIRTCLGNCSERQARRWLDELRRRGIPIHETWEGGIKHFWLPPEHRAHPCRTVDLTEDELFALAVAAEASRAALAPTPLGKPLGLAFATLLNSMSDSIVSFDPGTEESHWHFNASTSVAIDPVIFTRLVRAIEDCCCIRIDYLTASTGKFSEGRCIEPYGIAVRNGSWLLVARDRRKGAMRDFSLAGISRLELEDDAFFIRPDDFDLDRYFAGRFSALAGDRVQTVRLRVVPERAEYFRRKQYHPTQAIEEIHADGSIVVAYSVLGLDEMRCFAQGWGVGVTVLEPEELVDIMRREAKELAERYGG